jgi:hypothetical protein
MGHQRRRVEVLLALCSIPILLFGCTSAQLRQSTVAHSTTLADIYTQQVVNNLAMFVHNPDALPFFAFPNQGTTSIQDTGNVGNPGYVSQNFVTSPFTLNASRQATENWVLSPISDPAKLALMRCAYRQAISSHVGVDLVSESSCPPCSDIRRDFYGPADSDSSNPRANEELPCLNSPCWFCTGPKVPKNCECPYVGCYCGTYVWVPPEGREMLTRLTLTILDYAVNDPKQFEKRTKQVELYLDANGNISYTTQNGVKVTATIPIDEPNAAIAVLDRANDYRAFFLRFRKETADRLIEAARKDISGYDQLSPDQKLEYWQKQKPEEWPDEELRKAVQFLLDRKIAPMQIPYESVLRGRALYQRKGAATDHLQALGQLLNAANPSTPAPAGK